jgi:iron complex outermembrane receptor protein
MHQQKKASQAVRQPRLRYIAAVLAAIQFVPFQAAIAADAQPGTSQASAEGAGSATAAATAEAAAAAATTVIDGQVADSIVVRGARAVKEEDAQRVPTSSYRVSGKELDRQQVRSLEDLQQLVPGINIQTTDIADTQITMRGVGDGGGQSSGDANIGMPSSVAVYVDNVYLARPGMLGSGLSDIDYVDVLTGAQGTTFGANSTGGVIDLHTKLPSFTPESSASVSAGQHGQVEAKASVSGPLSETLAGSVNLVHSGSDGNITNLHNGDTVNGSNKNAVRGQLYFKPIQNFNARFSIDYSHQSATPTPVLYATHTIAGVDSYLKHSALVGNNVVFGNTVDLDTGNYNHVVQGGASAELNWITDSGYRFRSVSAYRYFDYKPSISDGLSVNAYSNSGTASLDRTRYQEFRLDSPTGELFDYAAGLNYYGQTLDTEAHTRYGAKPVPGLLYDASSYNGLEIIRYGKLRDKSFSAFTQGTLHVNQKLDVTAGLRVNYDEKGGQFIRLNKAAFNSGYLQQYNTLPSATLAFKYLLTPDWSSYLATSYGEKAGGLNISAGAAKAAGYDTLIIKPEKTKSAELGVKGNVIADTLTLKADVFYTEVSDFQTQGYDADTQQSYLMNAGAFRSRGAEGTIAFTPTRNWKLDFSTVYNDARYLDYQDAKCAPEITLAPNPPASCDLTGKRVFNAPKLTYTASTRYSWGGEDGLRSFVSARYAYRSWMYGTVDDSEFTRVPGYGLLALSAGTSGKTSKGDWSVSLWLNNALDKTYYRRLVNGDYGSVGAWVGQPRTLGITLAYSQ